MSQISIAQVEKSYQTRHGSVLALADVNLSIAEGEFVSLVGPSGCGKSTLLYMVGGFLKPDSGRIEVDGKLVQKPGLDRGLVFQQYALFPWLTVLQNIAYGLEAAGTPRKQRLAVAAEFVSMVGLKGFEHRYPRELSGGMQQRVALARTLSYDPKILLLDEPFGALDSQTRESMQDELLRICASMRKTVLMVTHDVNEAVYLSKRVVVMSRRPGTIVDEFPVDIDRSQGREEIMLSDSFNDIRNKVWLAVRHQASPESVL
ncbi:ABC transporter ATP-binding protein [Pollutimonas thiosulfatoxidans]|uniref:Nitrate ABC transporter ATP-binding protein n=1 Tax=Pollutimonas thiosulfatoxidans TaxID=2028345 RepID=A0A410GEF1_9BURK|nr:ABC transporter ATP-binding protein [Pollutimonas thiosulfatoxidans]QAA94673.1 nitrate ABC transporter ATP-binding protein [Pollutimonas thiosulfatoxidans]